MKKAATFLLFLLSMAAFVLYSRLTVDTISPELKVSTEMRVQAMLKAAEGGTFTVDGTEYSVKNEDGALIRSDKIYYEGIEENVAFKIRYPLDVPADTVRIELTADRPD